MGQKDKSKAKERLDKYYQLAKEQGLRARSAFKLAQLNRKFNFLQKARTLIDLGAAPGGWLQIAQKNMSVASTIIGVDLYPIKAIPGVRTVIGDFMTPKVHKEIKQLMQGKQADVILHDGSPHVTGAWDKDLFVQNVLVLEAAKIASIFLAKGGLFVSKIFRSQDYNKLLFVLKELFDKVHATKPESSRSTSAEIYVVCMGFKAPKTIDPRFFQPRHVFTELIDEEKENQILNQAGVLLSKRRQEELKGSKKKKAAGYTDSGSLLFKRISATDFLNSWEPVRALQEYNEITFDASEERFKTSQHTDPMVLEACSDLQQCNVSMTKKLLKWQKNVWHEERTRVALDQADPIDPIEAPEDAEAEAEYVPHEMDSDEEIENMQRELDRIGVEKKREAKKRLKKEVEKKLKIAARASFNPEDDFRQGTSEGDLFSSDKAALLEEYGEIDAEDYDANFKIADGVDISKFENTKLSNQLGERTDRKIGVRLDQVAVSDDEDEEEEEPELEFEKPAAKEAADPKTYFSRVEKLLQMHQNRGRDEEDENSSVGEEEPHPLDMGMDMEGLGEEVTDSEEEAEPMSDSDNDRPKKRKTDGGLVTAGKSNKVATTGFESVPSVLRDPEQRAKIHAIAYQMLDRKKKREILEEGVNRWCFNDHEELPEWFVEDERKNCFRRLPVTEEELEIQKERFKTLNARPPKKVMQAVARKRVRAKKIINSLSKKAKEDQTGKRNKALPSVRQLMRGKSLNRSRKFKPEDSVSRGQKRRLNEKNKKSGSKAGRTIRPEKKATKKKNSGKRR
eukprot:NODE_303_length_2455_cov_31.324742_g281_i0.p1 GENE.NODE_303_length_2455_cov_31.324742_g281_i0~~NODE_303_length_2455_cov_31.324742_g281_i0.p1  ORF type:complete len:792 (+),score=308.70 NODE_303_length_2455_cov_31.324742_g281_i0:13-2388(+)